MHLIFLTALVGGAAGASLGLGLDFSNQNSNLLFIGACFIAGLILGSLLGLLLKIDQRTQGLLPWIGGLLGIFLCGLLFVLFTLLIVPNHSIANWRLPVIFSLVGSLPGALLGFIFSGSRLVTASPSPVAPSGAKLVNSYSPTSQRSPDLNYQISQLEEWVTGNWVKGGVRVDAVGSSQRIKIEIYPGGEVLEIEIACGPDYPQTRPRVLVRLNDKMKMFQSSILEFWNGQATLTELVDNIVSLMGYDPQTSVN